MARTRPRRNPPPNYPLERDAVESGLPLQEVDDALGGALSREMDAGSDTIAGVMQEMAREASQAFFEVLMSGVPGLRSITPQEQDDLMLFYLTVPYGTWLWGMGREDQARTLLKAAKSRFLAVIGAGAPDPPPLARAFEDTAISNELNRSWVEAQAWFQDAIERLTDELADHLYQAIPGLPHVLYGLGVDDLRLRQTLAVQFLDRIPLAGYGRFETGLLEYGDLGARAAQYGVQPPTPPQFDPEWAQ